MRFKGYKPDAQGRDKKENSPLRASKRSQRAIRIVLYKIALRNLEL